MNVFAEVFGWAFSGLTPRSRNILALGVAGCALTPLHAAAENGKHGRVVHADVVVLDQLLVYNRFGSFDPFGMIYALRRDVSKSESFSKRPTADECGDKTGAEEGEGELKPGKVRLKDCKRARPLVLRAAVGDILEIRLQNLLRQDQPGISSAYPDKTPPKGGFCQEPPSSDDKAIAPVRADLRTAFSPLEPPPADIRKQCEEAHKVAEKNDEANGKNPNADWPRTRGASLVIPGLEPIEANGKIHGACIGLDALKGGEQVTCRWRLDREGTHLFSSYAAPAGGEGMAGSLGHGLFGALIIEPEGSRFYRSQVTTKAFDAVWPAALNAEDAGAPGAKVRHARRPSVSLQADEEHKSPAEREAFKCGDSDLVPILEMTRSCGQGESAPVEIVHGDLNAIIVPKAQELPTIQAGSSEAKRRDWRLVKEAGTPFREFVTIFHDELKTYYADQFRQLPQFAQLSGVRDGFAINYGASSVGTAMLANRLRIGPAANCPECLYEEFFLESWANGDPALLEAFPDDPSNVHHSYLNDKVVFRNFHAGKETHVFHLHSHQWFAGNDAGRGAYLDSQTIGPQQGFTYRIYHGGLERYASGDAAKNPKGWWDSLGTGNRNRTPGDAIFHCHLYPHFAQGMWELWRVHDVLEDGTRVLPDGQKAPGLSVDVRPAPNPGDERGAHVRAGSVGQFGEWNEPENGKRASLGTPIPGVIPLPGFGLPPLPTYTPDDVASEVADATKQGIEKELKTDAMVGFPFYVAGRTGHRSPQPPLDMATATDAQKATLGGRTHLDAGLPRHVVIGGVATPYALDGLSASEITKLKENRGVLARMLARGDMTSKLEHLEIELLPQRGTALERNAMKFHAGAAADPNDASDKGVRVLSAAVDGSDKVSRPPEFTFKPLLPNPTPGGAPNVEGQEVKTQLNETTGAYPTSAIPLAAAHATGKSEASLDSERWFAVNGSPGAPGAPFADPCAAPLVFGRSKTGEATPGGPQRRLFDAYKGQWDGFGPFKSVTDPVGLRKEITTDPGLLGFRRFEVSAVELKLIVNRAGWHDPQARINVLSEMADKFKGKARSDAEPFFFRAFSGECIEFRHTNETPKDLALDDFQMRVPTDTIGQHIHLVKFDVTSSDGSGNGFNYEDGTFAPDEALARICESKGRVSYRPGEDRSFIDDVAPRDEIEECSKGFIEQVSKRSRLEADNLKYFQTTVQRWFADPILSYAGPGASSDVADRTMRTVFTHDHFGPSNIQQHGFYSALLIEPAPHAVCPLVEPNSSAADDKTCVKGPAADGHPTVPSLAATRQLDLIGARANVFQWDNNRPNTGKHGDPIHPDAREYAIAIADFALLYDGKTGVFPDPGDESNGIDRLIHDARNLESKHPDDEAEEVSPAKFLDNIDMKLEDGAITALVDHKNELRRKHGKPVSAPPRPEAISQKHHDPYLVNYRNEPAPLRVGTTSSSPRPSFVTNKCREPGSHDLDKTVATDGADSIVRQRDIKADGDLADLFRTATHGDPCTPILEGLSGDRIVVRMIQGAQEVQHTFMIEGRTGRRNVDQPFPSERPTGPEVSLLASRAAACASNKIAKDGSSYYFGRWALKEPTPVQDFFKKFERLIAGCDNPLGYISAQEIGISEHFEVGSLFFAAGNNQTPMRMDAMRMDDAAGSLLADGEKARPQRPLDNLYHFGSVDALWNGAWGLIRVHDSVNSPDVGACMSDKPEGSALAECLQKATPIKNRLETFDALRKTPFGPHGGAPLLAPVGASRDGHGLKSIVVGAPTNDDGPMSTCPANAPRVQAAVAAARAVDIWPWLPNRLSGVRYGRRLFDRDGLVLVPLKQADLASKHMLLRARLRAGKEPKPFVLRVRAGDCVELTTVNLIPASGDRWDRTGDALMPRITTLNVDRDRAQYGGSKKFEEHEDRLMSGASREITPSRRVALSLPLPSPQTKPQGLLPVGVNDVNAVAPDASSGRSPHRSTTVYYAGFYWVDDGLLLAAAKAKLERSGAPLNAYSLADLSKPECAHRSPNGATEQRPTLRLLGVDVCLYPVAGGANASQADVELAQSTLEAHFADATVRAEVTHSIPYAFGALPIRSIGDVISHGGHGLLGTLVVEAVELTANDNSRPKGAGLPSFAQLHDQSARVTAPELVFDGADSSQNVPGITFREQVLVWQDGLNLRRVKNSVKDLGGWGRPVPNCLVCDDSYDLGEHGVSYRSAPFAFRLVDLYGAAPNLLFGIQHYPRDEDDLNRLVFPPTFFKPEPSTPTIRVEPSEQIAIRVAHPAGRARQRAFMSTATGYDDLFPGFGSGHSPLIGPGKALTAWGCAPQTPGTYLWRDGPQNIFAAGAWGHLEVGSAEGKADTCADAR